MNEKFGEVRKYLKKRKEQVILELIIRDYDKSNFYIALVFNTKIEKFKVLFIPFDVVDKRNLDEYVCYQFIHVSLVNYILQTFRHSRKIYLDDNFRDHLNRNISNYYIELHTYIDGEDYTFVTTQYIPKEWIFLFEVIVILFEHVPNIMGELCKTILMPFDDSADIIEYKTSFNFNLFEDDLTQIFSPSVVFMGEELYSKHNVLFLEKVNGKYFAIVHGHIVVVEYNEDKKVLNSYCDCSSPGYDAHIYAVIRGILDQQFRPFYKLMVVDDKDDFSLPNVIARYYLCYGMENDALLVIHGSKKKYLPLSMLLEGLIKVISDPNRELEKQIRKQLSKKLSKEELEEILLYIRKN